MLCTEIECFCFTGMDRKAVPVYAEADWLRRFGRGHDHRSAAQQSQTVGEAHYSFGNRDICQSGAHQQRTEACHVALFHPNICLK